VQGRCSGDKGRGGDSGKLKAALRAFVYIDKFEAKIVESSSKLLEQSERVVQSSSCRVRSSSRNSGKFGLPPLFTTSSVRSISASIRDISVSIPNSALFSGIGEGSGDEFNRSNDAFRACTKDRNSAGLGSSVTTFGAGV
jgi:hypothetical protein